MIQPPLIASADAIAMPPHMMMKPLTPETVVTRRNDVRGRKAH